MERADFLEGIPQDLEGVRQYVAQLRADYEAHNHDGTNTKSFRTLKAETVSARALSIRKTSFTNIVSGLWMGLVGNVMKLYLGDSKSYMKWDGTALTIIGRIFSIGATISTDFETAARFTSSLVGTGSVSYSINGVGLATGTTNPSSSAITWSPVAVNVFRGSPVFATSLDLKTGVAKAIFAGLGTMTDTTLTWTTAHIGFKILAGKIYASVADGSTETAVELGDISTNDIINVMLKVNGTTSVDFYWRKYFTSSGGTYSEDWSVATTISTNIPASASPDVTFRVDNQASASNSTTTFFGAVYSI